MSFFFSNSPILVVGIISTGIVLTAVILNVVLQLFFSNPEEPPVVFHWFPFVGSTVEYGREPYQFFDRCQKKYGNCFTFILLARKTTVFLGPEGNHFILNAKLKDLNAEEMYSPLTTPVFGAGVVYDCPNSKLMEQKKVIKFGLTAESLRSYVPLISHEVEEFLERSPTFEGLNGTCNITKIMAEITIYTASRALQGKEVRARFDSTFAELYHDLDMGFSPINFMFPWAPLPHNRKRDFAQRKMTSVYLDIISKRRVEEADASNAVVPDMIWNLMHSTYKDGTKIPDLEIAHMMIALLMAGQHSSSAMMAWIMIRLAMNPTIIDELYQEQVSALGSEPLSFENLQRLPLNQQVVKEALRLHAPIHSMMRKVKSPMVITGVNNGATYQIPTTHVLLSAPGVMSRDEHNFADPLAWNPHRWDPDSKMSIKLDGTEETIDYGFGLVSKSATSPYLPFGAGRHRCIGEQFAYVQLETITATMVRELTWKRSEKSATERVGTDYSSLFSRPLSPATISWEKRKKMN